MGQLQLFLEKEGEHFRPSSGDSVDKRFDAKARIFTGL